MADQSETNEEQRQQQFQVRQREAVNNAYAALVGQQYAQSAVAFTFEEALDAHIERIEGPSTPLRPNQIERVDRIENELLAAVESLKQVPPEQIIEPDPEEDVNTDV
jgi:hypothetical protein